MVNELLITYGLYRIGSALVFSLVIIGALLLFTPVGWLILGSIWLLSNVAKGVAEQVTLEDAQPATEGVSARQIKAHATRHGSANPIPRP